MGEVVGSYKLIGMLGQGAMGQVFLAEHTRIGRKVALKMLRRELSADPMSVRRFFSEAQAVNRISHENIVEITDFVENPGGDNYFIMELLKGEGLAELMKHEGILPLPRMLNICRQTASALAAVHAAGVVHRDLKPDNIFLIERSEKKDFVKLLDFGVAKLTLDLAEVGAMQKTNAGSILGTPEYMSPEQVAGKAVDFKSDVYSFGILLYEMTTGQKPFNAASFGDLVIKHLTVTPPKPSKVKNLPHEVPFELETLILTCLAKDPHKRPASMTAVEKEINDICDVVLGVRTGTAWHRKNPRQAGVLAAGLVGGVLITGAIFARSNRQSELSAQAPATSQSLELHVRSRPAGAQVLHGTEILGITPLELHFPSDGSTIPLTFRRSGYLDAVVEQQLQGSEATLEAELRVQPAPPPSDPLTADSQKISSHPLSTKTSAKAKPAPVKRTLDHGAVLDPFGD